MFSRKPDQRLSAFVAEPQPSNSAPPPLPPPPLAAQRPAAAPPPAHDGEPQSVIGRDLSIEGDTITIRCKGSLRVNGNIQADLHSRQLVVGEEAVINGSVAANEIAVYGRVNGAIYGNQVTLHASAKVDGDIHSLGLSIERGATFDGRSRKVNDPAEIAPKLETGQGGTATPTRPGPNGAIQT